MKPPPNLSPLGVLEEQILVAVVRTRGEAYGMNVRREIEKVTGRELAIGAVYATLDRLEAKGFLRSSRVGAEGPTRSLFEVTALGARALTETNTMRDRLWEGINVRALTALAQA